MDRHRLVTERLDLDPITMADAERLAVLHADARVMNLLKHGVLSRSQSDALVADYEAEWPALGFGSWTACERTAAAWSAWAACASRTASVALRLAFIPQAQGKGYGPELGRAALAFAFDVVGLDRVVAITRLDNLPGQRSLEKVGMRREREVKLEGGRTVLLYAAFNPKSGRDEPQRAHD